MGGLCSGSSGSQQTISASNNQIPCHASTLNQPSMPYSYGKPITVEQLTRLRLEFWSTRVGGDVNMWQALKSASEALISNDIDMARAILGASEITITNGSIGTCYDTRFIISLSYHYHIIIISLSYHYHIYTILADTCM